MHKNRLVCIQAKGFFGEFHSKKCSICNLEIATVKIKQVRKHIFLRNYWIGNGKCGSKIPKLIQVASYNFLFMQVHIYQIFQSLWQHPYFSSLKKRQKKKKKTVAWNMHLRSVWAHSINYSLHRKIKISSPVAIVLKNLL